MIEKPFRGPAIGLRKGAAITVKNGLPMAPGSFGCAP